jgi:PAS domain S-box-containing protein
MKGSWLDRAPLPIGVIRAGRYVYANQALLDLVAVPSEQFLGQPFLDRVAPEDVARVRERHERRLRGEPVPGSYELEIVRGDGARRTVELWASPPDADGDVLFALNDRTDRALRQAKLAALARLGAAVQVEQTEEAVHAALARGITALGMAMVRFAPTNAAPPLRVLQLSAPGDLLAMVEVALGRKVTGLLGLWAPGAELAWREGAAFLDDMPLAVSRFFAERDPAEAASQIARAAMFGRGVVIRVDAAGSPLELVLLMADWLRPEDLPACRLFGAQISAALDAARVIRDVQERNAALAAQGRIAAHARNASDLGELFALGAEEIVGVLGCDAVAIYLVDEARGEALLRHVRGGSDEARRALKRVPLAGTNLGLVARAGAPRVFHRDDYDEPRRALLDRMGQRVIVSVPLVTRGKVLGVMNVAYRDEHAIMPREIELLEAAGAHFAASVEAERLVADLRKSYADLARAQEQLVQRERLAAIGELAAVVAHEVRNPLGVLFNSLGALRKLLGTVFDGAASGPKPRAGEAGAGVEGHVRTLLGIMDEESARLNHIVGDLLDFARPTTPALLRERLDHVLEEAVAAALGDSHDRVQVVREIAPLPLVPMDARLLRQALVNVVQNAVQAMPAGGTITLRLGPDEVDGASMACIEISDTGPGIAPDVEPRIFEPFFTTRATGTGLGLAVVKRIVDGHRGRLKVGTGASPDGRGATFTLWIPLDEDGARTSQPDSTLGPRSG